MKRILKLLALSNKIDECFVEIMMPCFAEKKHVYSQG